MKQKLDWKYFGSKKMYKEKQNKNKLQKNKINNFLVIYLIIVLFTFGNYTFSKYTSTSEATATIKVAKFNVTVNDKKLGKEEKFNLLLNSSGDNVYKDKLLPDSEGYFEIEINPDGTHVNLEYEINFDLSKINSEIINENNDTRNIVLTGYSIDEGNTILNMPANNTIKGEMIFKNSEGFLTSDAITIRVYWEWVQDIINPTFENPIITVTSTVKQKVSN